MLDYPFDRISLLQHANSKGRIGRIDLSAPIRQFIDELLTIFGQSSLATLEEILLCNLFGDLL
ncbi:hypothetical protein ASG11_17775 [Sphingomonas sp. Leaf357]|nr:hypothetical protein ASG11_17775 [Sphingomonas sp. Leaf357]